MEFKSKFKPTCKKIWQAFNSWRKKGMWFRVTVLLIIFSVSLYERLSTKNHVPLINELVWTACRAIRDASEPRVISAHLRYLHVKKSRQLQKQLRSEYNAGRLKLNKNELELLNANTLNANYNQLFAIAKKAKIVPGNLSLRQSKRAMLDKSLRLTDERFGSEWKDVKQQAMKEYHFRSDVLLMKVKMLWYAILGISPLPIIPVLPWFILCLTLGFYGARSKSKAKFVMLSVLTVIMTFVWLYFSAYMNENWIGWRAVYRWRLLGISIFFAVWALIGSILGKRLHNYALEYRKETKVFISLLLISGIIFLMAGTCFKTHHAGIYSWWGRLPGYYLLFRNFAFAPYFITIGVGVLFYTLFLILKIYAQKLDKNKWVLSVKYLVIVLLLAKLVYAWYPLLK